MLFWFLMGGIHTPFWQNWLKNGGLSPSEIGIVIGSAPFARPFLGLIIAWFVDKYGSRKWIISALSFGSAIVFSLYMFTNGFWPWLFISLIWAQLIWTASSLLTSMVTITTQRPNAHKASPLDLLIYSIMSLIAIGMLSYFYLSNQYTTWADLFIILVVAACCIITIIISLSTTKLDYGRFRLWGTVGTITGITYISYFLFSPNYDGNKIMVITLILGMVVLGIVGLFLPNVKTPKTYHERPPVVRLLREPPIVLLLIIAVLLQGSHGMLYAQGTNYWQEQGLDFGAIGKFWTFGNIGELIIFTIGWIFRKKMRASYILCFAAAIAALRWFLLAIYNDETLVIYMAMAFHGFTYALGHLGAMYWVEKHIPENLAASMQTLYTSVVFGIGIGANMILSGFYYQYISGAFAWMVMAIMALCAAFVALWLSRYKNWVLR